MHAHNEPRKEEKLPNVFFKTDVIDRLLALELPEEKETGFTADMVDDFPWMIIFRSNEKQRKLSIYNRGEIYSHDDSNILFAECTEDKKTGKLVGSIPDNKDMEGLISLMYAFSCKLSRYLSSYVLPEEYEDLDPEEGGILLYLENGEINHRRIVGKERPAMLCTTLFGGTTVVRPYMDDIVTASSEESMIEAAENGDEFYMMQLAMGYLGADEDSGLEKDPEKAYYWFQKAAAVGNANAMFNLGLMYAKGYGVKRDFTAAAEWMDKASLAGDEDGIESAKKYRLLAEAIPKAESGDAKAQAELASGLMGLGGSLDQAGPGEDYKESLKWAKLASAQKEPSAFWTLGLAYEHGRGARKNAKKAAEYYKQGSELGNPDCMDSYACAIMRGDVKEEQSVAFQWFLKAAKTGHVLACLHAAQCYTEGTGVDKNFEAGMKLAEKAAKNGGPDEWYQVAMMYTATDENDKMINPKRARYWFKKAANAGNYMAQSILDAPVWDE